MRTFRALSLPIMLAALLHAVPAAAGQGATPAAETNKLWKAAKSRNYLPEMSWPEVQDLLTRTDMVIIPVGALEQHGLHGPIGTDFLNGTERAKLIAQRTDVLVAPILMPGNSPYHLAFPGTITLSPDTVQRVYFEAVQSLIKQGFKRFLLLNSHAGNQATTQFIVDRINQETPGIAVELNAAAAPFLAGAPPRTRSAPRPFDRHGGVAETSSSLYLTPGLVNLQAARAAKLKLPPHLQAIVPAVTAGDPTANLVFLAEALKSEATGKGTSTREMTDTGAWSELDPARATAAIGREDSERFVSASVRFIERWKELRPLGTK
jgi:creatinine amidohydrolase